MNLSCYHAQLNVQGIWIAWSRPHHFWVFSFVVQWQLNSKSPNPVPGQRSNLIIIITKTTKTPLCGNSELGKGGPQKWANPFRQNKLPPPTIPTWFVQAISRIPAAPGHLVLHDTDSGLHLCSSSHQGLSYYALMLSCLSLSTSNKGGM